MKRRKFLAQAVLASASVAVGKKLAANPSRIPDGENRRGRQKIQ